MKTIYLAGGCFWGVQKFFDQFNGVINTQTGYANGGEENVTYQQVCASSGHAETVKIDFDETKLDINRILELFFRIIDPFSVNKQGGDEGIQYRTGIYTNDEALLLSAQEYCRKVEAELGKSIAVEVKPLDMFCPAEEYHQKYLEKNPNGYCHINKAMFTLEKNK